MENNKKYFIYMSGPYQGKQENEDKMKQAIIDNYRIDKHLNCKSNVYINPISCFGCLFHETEYLEGLDMCLELLNKCDAIYMLPGWKKSTGACIEYGYAKAKGLAIIIYPEEE